MTQELINCNELLRKYAPVVKLNRGENFRPVKADTYVENSSLWYQEKGSDAVCILPEGEVSLEALSHSYPSGTEELYFLKFMEPLNLSKLAAYRIQKGLGWKQRSQNFLKGTGRLARVGYLSRLVDAAFSLTLLWRGRVPGDSAAAAALFYDNLDQEKQQPHYYGRVLQKTDWTVLQYWFFYPFNDWRTSFNGVNDHEGDWESVFLFLYPDENEQLIPEWVAYSAHGYTGDDQRRRWDDPELKKVGTHPVIYVGAGSHASYFTAGEYQTKIVLSFLAPITRIVDKAFFLFRKALRMVDPALSPLDKMPALRIPFVDYARGDGLSIGEGQQIEWGETQLFNPTPGWVKNYQGLWGLYTRDPVAGEDAPAGPRYNRDGSVRQKWHDPVTWAGLEKVPPPNKLVSALEKRILQLDREIIEKKAQIKTLKQKLQTVQIELNSLEFRPKLKRLSDSMLNEIEDLEREIIIAGEELTDQKAIRKALRKHLKMTLQGEKTDPRAHLQHPHAPEVEEKMRFRRMAELWAALSIGLMMIAFVLVINLAPHHLPVAILISCAIILLVEATFWGYLDRLISIAAGLVSILAAFILLQNFFWEAMQVGILAAGAFLLWENLREFLR